jgi:hypothetical protein
MAAHQADGVVLARHQSDVDAAGVVAVDDHHVPHRPAADSLQDLLVELLQHRAALGLDDGQHVGVQIADDTRRVAHGDLVHGLVAEFQRAGPVGPAVGDDLDATGLWTPQQLAAIATQGDELGVVLLFQPQADHQLAHALLARGRVVQFAQQFAQGCEVLQDDLAFAPGAQVHGSRSVEQVFHVVDGQSHDVSTSADERQHSAVVQGAVASLVSSAETAAGGASAPPDADAAMGATRLALA